MKRLIVTADDFGRCLEINDAVEDAYRNGILTSASLMVTGAAVEDAVERARRLPDLAVGLHVTLVDGAPVCMPDLIPDLLEADGRFTARLVALGVRIGFEQRVRDQIEVEIRAQFENYRATGLALDHVDSHHHYHLHPAVSSILVRLAKEFGAPALRIPWEPPLALRNRHVFRRVATALFHAPMIRSMRKKAKAAGLATNDRVFGFYNSGDMDAKRVRQIIEALPDGVSELYCHPASGPWDDYPMPARYRCVDEYRALVDPKVIAAVRRSGAKMTTFAELRAEAGAPSVTLGARPRGNRR